MSSMENVHRVESLKHARQVFREIWPNVEFSSYMFCYVSNDNALRGLTFRSDVEYFIHTEVDDALLDSRIEISQRVQDVSNDK